VRSADGAKTNKQTMWPSLNSIASLHAKWSSLWVLWKRGRGASVAVSDGAGLGFTHSRVRVKVGEKVDLRQGCRAGWLAHLRLDVTAEMGLGCALGFRSALREGVGEVAAVAVPTGAVARGLDAFFVTFVVRA
jgi:hypothetical protein